MIASAKKLASKLTEKLSREATSLTNRNLLLNGRLASWQVRSKHVLAQLDDAEFQVYSQYGQDGIIDWLIERAQIPPASQTFVEFGVESYREANTRFLLHNRNWRGLIIDGDPGLLRHVLQQELAWKHQLAAVSSFIDRDNINALIANAGFHGDVGLLSIDIDGNDYWVWEAINVVNPILVVCEFNAVLGDVHAISVPYDAHFQRTKAHFSNLYFGASIQALCHLAQKKGYQFVGTNTHANDAFFVRVDHAQRFTEAIQHIGAHPSLLRESRDQNGELTYATGVHRIEQIATLPVVRVQSGETVRLGDLQQVYSADWIAAMSPSITPS